MNAEVSIELWPQPDSALRLPGSGSRSLMYRFPDGLIGAVAVTADGRDLAPGVRADVTLTFWNDDAAREVVTDGASFVVWLGGDIGAGVVRQVVRDA